MGVTPFRQNYAPVTDILKKDWGLKEVLRAPQTHMPAPWKQRRTPRKLTTKVFLRAPCF